EMAADMLVFDVAAMRCAVVWRGRATALEGAWLAAGLSLPGAGVDWSQLEVNTGDAGGTRGLDREALRRGGALPWERAGEPKAERSHGDARRLPWERSQAPTRARVPWERPGESAADPSTSAPPQRPLGAEAGG